MEWEFEILDFLQSIHSPVLNSLMSFVTFLGEAGWFWILLGLLLLMKKYRASGAAVLIALVFDFVLANRILKPLVARPRPCWINDSVEMLIRVPEDFLFLLGIPWHLLRQQGPCSLWDIGLVSGRFFWQC